MKKNCFRFAFVIAVVAALSAGVLSCKSTKLPGGTVTVEETQERMLWKVSGTDKNGNPSTVYVLGTIHVGDEKLYPLSDGTIDAINNCQRFVAEISSEDMKNLQTRTVSEVQNAVSGKDYFDSLTDAQKNLLKSMGNEDEIAVMTQLNPWVLNSVLSAVEWKACGFDSQYGMDNNLHVVLAQSGVSVEGLDDMDTQFNIIKYGDYNQQLQILQLTMDSIIDADHTKKMLLDLYDAYLKNDKAAMKKALEASDKEDAEKISFAADYEKAVLNDRNEKWAKKIRGYLNDGGTTFLYAGCAHFVDHDNVFEQLTK